MTPKLYQLIPGSQLNVDQIRQVTTLMHPKTFPWIGEQSWYFTADGTRFLEVWRSL